MEGKRRVRNNQIMDMMPKDVIASDSQPTSVYLFLKSTLIYFRLPVPWLLWTLVNYPCNFGVNSGGVGCSIGLLFLMLVLVFLSIVFFNWKMTKPMGVIMGFLYIGFVIVSVALEKQWIMCPLGSG